MSTFTRGVVVLDILPQCGAIQDVSPPMWAYNSSSKVYVAGWRGVVGGAEAVTRRKGRQSVASPRPKAGMVPLLLLLMWSDCLRSARVTVREAPTVNIPAQGLLAGLEVFVTRTQRARQYLGIPFAQPPVGALRFSPPVTHPLPSWEVPRNSSYQAACMQDREEFEDHDKLGLEKKLFPDREIEFKEDCLYLNIFVPDGTVYSSYLDLRSLSAYLNCLTCFRFSFVENSSYNKRELKNRKGNIGRQK